MPPPHRSAERSSWCLAVSPEDEESRVEETEAGEMAETRGLEEE